MTAIDIDNTFDSPLRRSPLVLGGRNFTSITDEVCNVAERPTTLGWKIGFAFSLSLLSLLGICVIYLFTTGVGVWGNNQPVGWGFGIVNFVFWVGIGHAGTLISAILFLFRQNWRTGINRFAEAMTIFAVMCAAMFPGIHIGRPWMPYYLFPIPNQMQMWPQFRSPLMWDVFAVGTYATVSVLFWYVGMVPDLATLRDRSNSKIKQFLYGMFALGWNGSCRHWHRYERAYLLLAALATPLVLSVHSVVSFDFATSQLPGWHTTIFPPYFVAGAVYGGFAMVLNLAIPAREWFGLKDIITLRHIENCCKILLATGMIVAYAYSMEFWTAWYSGNHHERFGFWNRAFGPYAWSFWIMIWCNAIAPQFMWSKKLRTNVWFVFVIALFGNIGMWFERFEIIITSLTRDFLPSSWWRFRPTLVDLGTLAGSFGLFLTLFMLFCRYLPVVAMAEVKAITPEAHPHHDDPEHQTADEKRSDYRPDEKLAHN
ncbi:MAG TPA: NrfD/PsrC family molybdoenzyme membrane anchor subunit [Humisphaera sp.]|jgi:molybdopterin-containing oxidoreductase family membrane subunit|nr:NrfD/PsrC family molybdoenzyme membrane anchor subunit [Humisphaera sp.]